MGVNSLPETVTRQRRGCDLHPTAPESSTLTTRLSSHSTSTDKEPEIVDTVRTVMRSRVYETVWCPSVRPSVRLCECGPADSSKATAAGLLLWARWAGDINRLLQQRRRANAGNATLSAYVGS